MIRYKRTEPNRKQSRRRNAIWILTGLMGLTVAGCAATPEKAIVAQKDSDRLVEAAEAEPEDGSALGDMAKATPDSYRWDYSNGEGTVHISADAAVVLPEGDSLPMYRVSCGEISQELATAVFDYFFPEGDAWTTIGTTVTKAVCEERIILCRQEIAELEAGIGVENLTQEGIEQLIENRKGTLEYWENLYETAPEESTIQEVKVDGTLQANVDSSGTLFETVNGANDEYLLYIRSVAVDSGSANTILCRRYGTPLNYSGEKGTPVSQADEAELAAIPISREQAKQMADDLFEQIGVAVSLQETLALRGWMDAPTEEDPGKTAYSEAFTAYQFCYVRSVGGVDVATTSKNAVYAEEAALIWLYERIYVIVNEKGIICLDWQYVTNIGEVVSENVGVLSFDEATEIFEEMTPLIYEGNLMENFSYDVTVDQVRLCLMRVRDSGGQRTGVLTPAWVFYGTEATDARVYNPYTESWSDNHYVERSPYIILAVNAVDGSVIDVIAGY